ncbi:putative multi-copper oxidase [Aspergillus japonicus CBS 114.51]|uniref:Putative multi-copper oxidase n=1 Tax=Aspergillus japonicus CBS 114.51 TaxID=1448312 RepID=A0A8T8X5D6_ASPJA|nr:putative multi-copper oxidase [Aspergillus japonicus CBS 114.51]RAH83160.1 putative multi-copper oxidase [Aspergillus japonicus CBS 114.51]
MHVRGLLWTLLTCVSGTLAAHLTRHDESFSPDYILRVTEDTVPIACRTRYSALVNGSIPGPTLYLRENQTTWVRVYNDMLSNNLTIHWHGLTASAAPWADGTPSASQWPIKAQHFFDYELRPSIGEAGSYFYHSHVGFQASTVTGPLIVAEADGRPPYEYDEERILFLSELFNVTDETATEWLTDPDLKWPGEAEAILVNGQGYRGLNGSEAEASSPYGAWDPTVEEPCSAAVIEVEPDRTYRFRAIGGVALSPLAFAVEDHNELQMISIDGAYTQPASTAWIEIAGGQRYDFLLKTKSVAELESLRQQQRLKNATATNFWIQFETRYRAINSTFYAILSYNSDTSSNKSNQHQTERSQGHRDNSTIYTTVDSGPPAQKPIHIPYALQNWMEYTFEPLEANGFPPSDQVTREVYITAAQIVSPTNLENKHWTMSNRTWDEANATVPYLVDIYAHGEDAIPDYEVAVQPRNGGRDPAQNVYAAKAGELIDIIFVNQANGLAGGFDAHPFHIHGGHVWDLGSGPGAYNATANEAKLRGYNPVLRDTSLLYKYTNGDGSSAGNFTSQGWRAWRLKVDNTGVWMIHCHNIFHMIMGMQTVWVMGNASEITRKVEPALVEGYLTFGGNAYGNATYDPLVTHYFDD